MRSKVTESTAEIICPNGHPVDSSLLALHVAKYCIQCGAELTIKVGSVDIFRCSMCDTFVNESWPFCPYCGEKL